MDLQNLKFKTTLSIQTTPPHIPNVLEKIENDTIPIILK